jgi:hypothetical protein
MLAPVLALSAVLSSATAHGAAAEATTECQETTRAAIAYSEDSDPSLRQAVASELARACFTLVEVIGAGAGGLLDAARVVPAPWLLRAAATAVDDGDASDLSVTLDVIAVDVKSGQRRGRALRNVRGRGPVEDVARSRDAARVIADAIRVLRAQMRETPPQVVVDRAELSVEPRGCADLKYIVVLWHKASEASAKAAVLRALEARCVTVLEQIDGERTRAVDWARKLYVPLLAVKTTLVPVDPAVHGASHQLAITVDVVDAEAEGLKILLHASDARHALGASDDVEAWKKVEGSLLGPILERALAR